MAEREMCAGAEENDAPLGIFHRPAQQVGGGRRVYDLDPFATVQHALVQDPASIGSGLRAVFRTLCHESRPHVLNASLEYRPRTVARIPDGSPRRRLPRRVHEWRFRIPSTRTKTM